MSLCLLQVIRDGAAIAEIGGYKCIEVVDEGKTEWEIVQAATNIMTAEIARKYPHPPVLDSKARHGQGLNEGSGITHKKGRDIRATEAVQKKN